MSTPWFYLAVVMVSLVVKFLKDLDDKIHKRWYMPVALAGAAVAALVVALGSAEYALGSIPINAALIYVGQHFFGDQVIKRFEVKEE